MRTLIEEVDSDSSLSKADSDDANSDGTQMSDAEEEEEETVDYSDDQLEDDSDLDDDAIFCIGPFCHDYPPWIIADGFDSTKRTIFTGKFPFRELAGQDMSSRLLNEGLMANIAWPEYKLYIGRLMRNYKDALSPYFPHGLEPAQRQQFCTGVEVAFPLAGTRYYQLRDMAGIAKANEIVYGELSPALITTTDSSFRSTSFPVNILISISSFTNFTFSGVFSLFVSAEVPKGAD